LSQPRTIKAQQFSRTFLRIAADSGHISEANVTTKCYDRGFWGDAGRLSALLCLVAPQGFTCIENKGDILHFGRDTRICTQK
jgi:hypothetical protein